MIALPSGETFSKWRFIDIDRIEYSEEHKDKFEKNRKSCQPIKICPMHQTDLHNTLQTK